MHVLIRGVSSLLSPPDLVVIVGVGVGGEVGVLMNSVACLKTFGVDRIVELELVEDGHQVVGDVVLDVGFWLITLVAPSGW